jgi:hypothetical protein
MAHNPTPEEIAKAQANQATQNAKHVEAIVERVHDRVVKATETVKPK